jgi:hypothetical protein
LLIIRAPRLEQVGILLRFGEALVDSGIVPEEVYYGLYLVVSLLERVLGGKLCTGLGQCLFIGVKIGLFQVSRGTKRHKARHIPA